MASPPINSTACHVTSSANQTHNLISVKPSSKQKTSKNPQKRTITKKTLNQNQNIYKKSQPKDNKSLMECSSNSVTSIPIVSSLSKENISLNKTVVSKSHQKNNPLKNLISVSWLPIVSNSQANSSNTLIKQYQVDQTQANTYKSLKKALMVQPMPIIS